jgi:hypothetical protein
MPSLVQHQSSTLAKTLILGNPGAGKTGGLVSLVDAGYKLLVYDFDNLLGSLTQQILHRCPDKIGNVYFQTFTDKMKGLDVPMEMVGSAMKVKPFVDGLPTAFSTAMRQLNNWKTPEEELGPPGQLGPEYVVVIDSLSSMSQAVFRYVQSMNPSAREPQSYYFAAQQMIVNVLNLLCSKSFGAHVVVLAHIDHDRDEAGITKGWPRSIGSALKDQIGIYFNSCLMIEAIGSGNNIKRQIRTTSTGMVDLKNPAPFKVKDPLPLETGLADFFAAITTAANTGDKNG